jgi:hypothetical protein
MMLDIADCSVRLSGMTFIHEHPTCYTFVVIDGVNGLVYYVKYILLVISNNLNKSEY